ncbi:MAG: ABC transporter ATP-binding protein [Eudoraea sp.]|nr:ABC transporter ATP-binding protein [Eudoraea sp.]
MLEVKEVSFAYDRIPVLEEIQFQLAQGEHLAVMGESGCGKSTLLKIIYGALQPSQGEIFWKGKQIKGPDLTLVPGKQGVKYMSQEFDLMPFTTVAENISAYLSSFSPKKLEKRVRELLYVIDMVEHAGTKVKNLSVGQQQRVGLAKVLAQKPELLLLDEPFGHIDNFRKNYLRRNLYDYLKTEGITCLTATHDSNDVLPFADKGLVLKDHVVLAHQPILELYDKPRDLYVASLFGEANKVAIDVIKTYANTKRRIIVYAHEFTLAHAAGIPAVVIKKYPMGSHFLYKGEAEDQYLLFESKKDLDLGTEVKLNISIDIINKRLQNKNGY